MKTTSTLLPCLLAVLQAFLLAACGGGPAVRPATPPTFVAAWTLQGPAGQVWTAESNDGIVWQNARAQNLQGNQSEANAGPAIAHDGNLGWMLMWPNRRGLDYKTGAGGLALSGRGGVVWEAQPQQGRLPFPVLGNRPVGSPALAYAQGRWIVAFRVAGTGDRLRIVRSEQNSARQWEAPFDVTVSTPAGIGNISSAHNPALAYGQGTLVLVHRGQGGFSATTSTDGLSWTSRGQIALIPEAEMSDPAVSYSGGNFYVALRKRLPIPPGWGAGYNPSAAEIYKSADGAAWTRIADKAGYFSPIGKEFGPGFSFGNFGNNVCRAILIDRAVQLFPASIGPARGIQQWTGTVPPPHTCADPGLLQFAPLDAAGAVLNSQGAAYRTAIAFGAPGP